MASVDPYAAMYTASGEPNPSWSPVDAYTRYEEEASREQRDHDAPSAQKDHEKSELEKTSPPNTSEGGYYVDHERRRASDSRRYYEEASGSSKERGETSRDYGFSKLESRDHPKMHYDDQPPRKKKNYFHIPFEWLQKAAGRELAQQENGKGKGKETNRADSSTNSTRSSSDTASLLNAHSSLHINRLRVVLDEDMSHEPDLRTPSSSKSRIQTMILSSSKPGSEFNDREYVFFNSPVEISSGGVSGLYLKCIQLVEANAAKKRAKREEEMKKQRLEAERRKALGAARCFDDLPLAIQIEKRLQILDEREREDKKALEAKGNVESSSKAEEAASKNQSSNSNPSTEVSSSNSNTNSNNTNTTADLQQSLDTSVIDPPRLNVAQQVRTEKPSDDQTSTSHGEREQHDKKLRKNQPTIRIALKHACTSFSINPTSDTLPLEIITQEQAPPEIPMELLLGFQTGDILIYEPIFKSFSRQFNQNSLQFGKETAVTHISFLPNFSDSDGLQRPITSQRFSAIYYQLSSDVFFYDRNFNEETKLESVFHSNLKSSKPKLQKSDPKSNSSSMSESPQAQRRTSEFAEHSKKLGLYVNYNQMGVNPYKRWTIHCAPNCPVFIHSVDYSPFLPTIAAVSCSDGKLRMIELETDRAICAAKSYFGSFLCAAWSANGKYLLTGSEDDLVSLWHWDRKSERLFLIARGEGHDSYVSAVAFDEHHSSDNLLRIGSVGEDGKLILWEFDLTDFLRGSSSELSAKLYANNSSPHPRPTEKQSDPLVETFVDVTSPPGNPKADDSLVIPSLSSRKVPKLEVVVSHQAHNEPCSGLQFTRSGIMTSSWGAHVKFWKYSNLGL